MNFPVLKNLSALPSNYSQYDFSSTVLVAIQHLLATNGSLLEVLNNLGLSYDRMFILGKAYSTSEDVCTELGRRGAYVHPYSCSMGEITFISDYRLELAKAADDLLDKAIKRLEQTKAKTLLVVDDGGILISRTNKRVRETRARIVAVEQTRSGAETLRALPELSFPVINVAESNKKLQDESPYIASSIIEHITKRLSRLPKTKDLKACNILVVGYGAVGRCVAEQVEPLAKSVHAHDVNKSLASTTVKTLVLANIEHSLRDKDVVIGCVGKSWFPANWRSLLKNNVVLASGSSSNTEFLGLEIGASTTHPSGALFEQEDLARTHADYGFAHDNGKGWVLNGGFPDNFDGSLDPIRPEIIQLTRMLMLSGILQALAMPSQPGLFDLKTYFE